MKSRERMPFPSHPEHPDNLIGQEADLAPGIRVTPETVENLIAAFDMPSKIAFRSILGQLCVARETSPGETFSADYWSLCIVKPDAKEKNLEDEIHRRIGERSLGIAAVQYTIELDEHQLDQIWPAPLDNKGELLPVTPWWEATVEYMTSAPVDLLLVHGEDASSKMKRLKRILRDEHYKPGYQGDEALPYGQRVKSIIHTSDSDWELFINTLGFWSDAELARIMLETRDETPPQSR